MDDFVLCVALLADGTLLLLNVMQIWMLCRRDHKQL